jgi:hypothetical protein
MNDRKLRLGILLDSYKVPAWAYNSLERIVNSHYGEFSLIILNDSSGIYESNFEEFWKNRNRLLYDLFNKVDERLFHGKPDAFKLKDLGEILSNVPVIKVKPVRDGYSDCLEMSDINRIKEYRLDILIKMGFRILRGDILTASKYGVWSYHHGDSRINRGGPPGFWEVAESWPETGSVLQILSEDFDNGKVLYRSWFFTYPFSPARNRNHCFWASSSFLPRQIELLHRLGEERFFKEITRRFYQKFNYYDHQPYRAPSNGLALLLITKLFAKMIFRLYQKAFYLDQWYLMFDLKKNRSSSFCDFKKIIPPKDRFWADPHVIKADGHYYIFVEEYVYGKKKGQIAVIDVDENGNCKNSVQVLGRAYHLSYPFVFEWGDRYYMVPESAQNKTIELYECVQFPYKWKFKMNLMQNVMAVDTTLFNHEGKWWLFTGMAEHEGSLPNVELSLFFSNELFTSDWNSHPMNPIVSDVKRARPAGKLFTRDGKIYRPSQNCSKMYGHGFDLNEVLLLSESGYLEKKVFSVGPHWDHKLEGTHTFTSEGQMTIIDAFMRRPRLFSNSPRKDDLSATTRLAIWKEAT